MNANDIMAARVNMIDVVVWFPVTACWFCQRLYGRTMLTYGRMHVGQTIGLQKTFMSLTPSDLCCN